MAFLTNEACRIYTPTSGRPLSPKFGQGGKGGAKGGATTAIAVVGCFQLSANRYLIIPEQSI